MTGIDRAALIEAAAKSMALDWKEWLREATAAVDAALPLIADAIEAERAVTGRGRPGYAVGNETYNEGIDRAAFRVRSLSQDGGNPDA